MGFSFWPTGYGQPAEECRSESRASDTDGSPRRAAKAKEKPAGVNRRARCYRLAASAIRCRLRFLIDRRILLEDGSRAFEQPCEAHAVLNGKRPDLLMLEPQDGLDLVVGKIARSG
jgi:hypothetical protein